VALPVEEQSDGGVDLVRLSGAVELEVDGEGDLETGLGVVDLYHFARHVTLDQLRRRLAQNRVQLSTVNAAP